MKYTKALWYVCIAVAVLAVSGAIRLWPSLNWTNWLSLAVAAFTAWVAGRQLQIMHQQNTILLRMPKLTPIIYPQFEPGSNRLLVHLQVKNDGTKGTEKIYYHFVMSMMNLPINSFTSTLGATISEVPIEGTSYILFRGLYNEPLYPQTTNNLGEFVVAPMPVDTPYRVGVKFITEYGTFPPQDFNWFGPYRLSTDN